MFITDSRIAYYIDTVEKSVFFLCLDDNSPVTREERIRSGYLGDSFICWHDKTFQILVTANGRRHSSLEEIPLLTTTDIEVQIGILRVKYAATTDAKQYTPHLITSFGKALFLQHSAPIKATVDLTIQLASRLYFGYLPASWETVSTAHFHLGRPDIAQVVLKSVIDFCDAALDSPMSWAEARSKLMHAARECNAQIVKGGEGRKYFRLTDILEVMSQDQAAGEVLALFYDPVWKRSYPQLIMQTMIETKLA
ncbi:lovastatin nonaketide synthase [Colletotrichum incanum]|uniref:Lovastatin nonaketide synthase n=1 Tax=Colletotrichum incanum TaxID=1573173 RepID=A0A167D5I4_COLIC|nr:lovastatin nonaketide synthase [Colletotrichum incanum]